METRIRRTKKAAETVASIDDLLIEILIRLPVSSLLLFKLVSKHWHSLITNPEFRRLWRNPDTNSAAVGMFLPTTSTGEGDFEYVPFFCTKNPRKLKDPSSSSSCSIRILSSCKGLLLCEIGEKKKDYCVYNPTTNQYSATLPKLPDRVTFIRGMTLAFDPPYPHYKVFCVHRLESLRRPGPYRYHIEIYSSDIGVWTSSTLLHPFIAYVEYENGVYWNNAIHWLNVANTDPFYFNVSLQELGKMPKPPSSRGRRNFYFGESCDHLHYIPIYRSDIFKFNVYEMKRDYSEWFLKYSVDLSLCVAANPQMTKLASGHRHPNFSLLSIVRGGHQDYEKEDASFLVLQIPGQAIRYNIVPKTFQILHQSKTVVGAAAAADFVRTPRANGFQYIESLSPV